MRRHRSGSLPTGPVLGTGRSVNPASVPRTMLGRWASYPTALRQLGMAMYMERSSRNGQRHGASWMQPSGRGLQRQVMTLPTIRRAGIVGLRDAQRQENARGASINVRRQHRAPGAFDRARSLYSSLHLGVRDGPAGPVPLPFGHGFPVPMFVHQLRRRRAR